ncbi:MAG: tRNA uridine-5-carboxymethylaminomethyl(34) synthesis GTPase MnmE, partial [Alphaproteobacteria bacterium]|nr:tRNA uridine-5-carboxymethylaminomethyl(34) synthesis GTPase MnmE [Alphaproteobacteria bacterium]
MPDTIFAIASGEGRSAIAVLRISGPAAGTAIASLAARQASGFDGGMPSPRRANVRMLYHPQTGVILDEALALWFPAPHSFTGEDCLELHIHGGPAVRKAVIDALTSLEGFRPARPGEFTRRAFANGKFDLVELEALADLIDAETELQRQQALAGYRGTFASKAAGWRERLVYLIATVEAHLDFADEGDAPEDPFAGTGEELQTIIGEMENTLQQARFGELIRRGARVVIAGPPNAGKSSLLNVLARRDVALVSSTPGTTRDVLEVRLDLDGLEVCVYDTAGLRETSDEVE